MPPSLNIYVLTAHRDLATIQRFLDLYVDQESSEDRPDEELMLVPLAANGIPYQPADAGDWDWEAAGTLSHVIVRGLDYPRRAFTIYLKSHVKSIERAILAFTTDDLIIFGLSIDDTQEQSENNQRAQNLLRHMEEIFNAYLGMICVEQPPPLNEKEFYEEESAPLTVYFSKPDSSIRSF